MNQYVNPFGLLNIDISKQGELSPAIIRSASKRILADIDLSDDKNISYKNSKLSKSDVIWLISEIEKPQFFKYHRNIYENKELCRFLEEAVLEKDFELENIDDNDFTDFLSPYFTTSFSVVYLDALRKWDFSLIERLEEFSFLLNPEDTEPAYSKCEKYFVALSDQLDDLLKGIANDKISATQGYSRLMELIEPAKNSNISILPSVFDNELDMVAASIRSFSIDLHNEYDLTQEATRLSHLAFRFARSPSLKDKLEKDLSTFREIAVKELEGDKKFRDSISNILQNAVNAIVENGRNGINLSKFNEMINDVFKSPVISAIKSDSNDAFKKNVRECVLKIIQNLGYKNSQVVITVFRSIFIDDNTLKQSFDSVIANSKSADKKFMLKGIALGGIRLVFSKLGLFLGFIIFVIWIAVTSDSSSSSSSSNSTEPNRTSTSPQVPSGIEGYSPVSITTGNLKGCSKLLYDWEYDASLRIKVGASADVAIKLCDLATDVCIRYCFIQRNTTWEISNIPEGKYYLKIASGTQWGTKDGQSLCEGRFLQYAHFEKGEDILDFNRKYTYDGYQIPSFQLFLDVRQTESANAFNSERISANDFYQ